MAKKYSEKEKMLPSNVVANNESGTEKKRLKETDINLEKYHVKK